MDTNTKQCVAEKHMSETLRKAFKTEKSLIKSLFTSIQQNHGLLSIAEIVNWSVNTIQSGICARHSMCKDLVSYIPYYICIMRTRV